MAKTPVKKKRAPQDMTLRNIRAANKRLDDLERRVTALENRLTAAGYNIEPGLEPLDS